MEYTKKKYLKEQKNNDSVNDFESAANKIDS
jgi:hypothetical protein